MVIINILFLSFFKYTNYFIFPLGKSIKKIISLSNNYKALGLAGFGIPDFGDYSFEVGDHFGDFINDNYGYASQSDEDSNDFGADGDGFDTSDEIGTESWFDGMF